MNTLAWSGKTTPLPTEANPRVVFERLFGDGGSAADRKAELRKNGSILDWVTEDMARLRPETGAGRSGRVDEYLDTVREVERRIQKAEQLDGDALPDVLTRPVGVPADWEEHAKLMFDLQVLALQADITRVVTFQLAREVSTRTYPQIGVSEPHHATSHHQNYAGEAREAGQDQRVPRVALRLPAREAAGHQRRRRHPARPLAVPAGQRARQSRRARSHEPADSGGGWRCGHEGRAPRQVRRAGTAHQPARHAARQEWACRPSGLPTARGRSTSSSSR